MKALGPHEPDAPEAAARPMGRGQGGLASSGGSTVGATSPLIPASKVKAALAATMAVAALTVTLAVVLDVVGAGALLSGPAFHEAAEAALAKIDRAAALPWIWGVLTDLDDPCRHLVHLCDNMGRMAKSLGSWLKSLAIDGPGFRMPAIHMEHVLDFIAAMIKIMVHMLPIPPVSKLVIVHRLLSMIILVMALFDISKLTPPGRGMAQVLLWRFPIALLILVPCIAITMLELAYVHDIGGGPYGDIPCHLLQDTSPKCRDAGHIHLDLKIGGDTADLHLSASGIYLIALTCCISSLVALIITRFLQGSHSTGSPDTVHRSPPARAAVTDGQARDQTSAYLVQIRDEENATVLLTWMSGSVAGGLSPGQSVPWIPPAATYTATTSA